MSLGGNSRLRAFTRAFVGMLILASGVAWAGDAPKPMFDVSVKAGFGGLHKGNELTPLRVHIKNPTEFKGVVTIRVDFEAGCPSADHGTMLRRFCRDVSLHGEAETTVIVPIRPTGNKCWIYLVGVNAVAAPAAGLVENCATQACPLYVPAPLDENKILASVRSDEATHCVPVWEMAVAIVSPTDGVKNALNARDIGSDRQVKLNTNTGAVAAGDLVEEAGLYRCLDGLVLDNLGSEPLSARQVEALRDWVVVGGTLIVTRACMEAPGGAELLRILCGTEVAGAAAPVDCSAAFAFFNGVAPALEPLEILPLRLPVSAFKIQANGQAVYAIAQVGQGRVVLAPFHTSGIRTAGSPDRGLQDRVWSRVLESVRVSYSYPPWRSVIPDSANVRHLALPYVLFVLVSALLLGPVCTLFAWRRHRRIHLLWLIPCVSVCLCGVSFAWGLQTRGSNPHMETVSLLIGETGHARGYVHQHIGILSGRAADYALGGIPGDSAVKESIEGAYREVEQVGLFPALVKSGDTIEYTKLHFNRWSMRFFEAWRCIDMPALSGSLHYADGKFIGWIKNDSPYTLEKAFLLFKWNKLPLPVLKPGERTELDFTLAAPPETALVFSPYSGRFDMNSDPLNPRHWPGSPLTLPQTELLRHTMQSKSVPCQEPTVVCLLPGAAETGPPPQLIGQDPSRGDSVIAMWRVPLEPGPGALDRLPSELCTALDCRQFHWEHTAYLYSNYPQTFDLAFSLTSALMRNPEIMLHSRLPEASRKKMIGDNKILFALYDWTSGTWETEERTLELGDMRIPDSARFVRPEDNRVRIKLHLEGSLTKQYTQVYLDRLEVSLTGAST